MTDDTSQANGKGPQPVFDFTKVTRRWNKAWLRTIQGLNIGKVLAMTKPREDLTQAEELQLAVEVTEAMDQAQQAVEERDALVAQVLVAVPSQWVHPDAPKDLDWADPESLDWLLMGKYEALIAALKESMAEVVRGSKN